MINYKEIFTVMKIISVFLYFFICNSSNACINGEEKSLDKVYSTDLIGSYFNGDLLIKHSSSGRPTMYFEVKDSNNKILKDSISFPKIVAFGYKEIKVIETFDCKYNIAFFGGWTMDMIIKRQPRTNISKQTMNVSIRMSGFRNTKQPRDPERVSVPNGVSKTIGLELGTSQEVQFSITEGNTQSVGAQLGVQLGIFQAAVNGEIQSIKEKERSRGHGQFFNSTYSVTVNGLVCNNWEITRYQTEEIAFVSASDFGITKEIPITMIISQRLEAVNLCEAQR